MREKRYFCKANLDVKMRIKHLNIRNFRGYELKSFDFDERLSVVVGNNTAGKTALLQAVQVALGAFLASLKALPNEPAYRHNFTKDDEFLRYDREKKDFFKNDEATRIDVDALYPRTKNGSNSELEEKPISWWLELRGNKTTHSVECVSELMGEVERMERKRETEGDNAIYPLVLSFGANRIDNQYRAASKTKARASKITKGYKSSLRETVDFQSAFDWLYRYEQSMKKGQEFEGTYEAVLDALSKAIPALTDVMVDSKNSELTANVSVKGQEPNYQTYEHMSDGFKSVICIVAEMAYRCVQLNGFLGRDAVKKTPGVVLIDELDLYLHPRWQKHLLEDLQKAFPQIQFIVSTHSPFIIQSVRKHNLITLDGVNDDTDPIYRSIEEIVTSEMNMETPRSKTYNLMVEKAERYYQLVKNGQGDSEEAKRVNKELDDIEQEFSNDPAYVALLKAERKSV